MMSDTNDIEKEKVLIYHVCSLGHECTSATVFKNKKIKFESHPFDWLRSNIDDIIDDLEQALNKSSKVTLKAVS